MQLRPGRPPHVLGLEDHLLWDSATGTIVHCQPHFELIVGDDMTKSFRVPIEPAMLSAASGSPSRCPLRSWSISSFLARKTLATGGLIVAVVGGDGSGKSSLVESLVETLSSVLDVRRIHLGKPPRGLLNRVVTRPLRIARNRGWFEATRLPAWSEFTEHPGTVYALWHWLIARDRHRAYLRARRAAGKGVLVVSDRFPLAGVASMDGSRLAHLPHHPGRRLARQLARAEAMLYRRIRPPDLVLVLRVSPEVAVQRRSDQDTEFVARRAQEVWDADWSGPEFEVLDASASAQEVADAALQAIWNRL
ncbi:MAG TPA: hypothetical protein VMS74_02770 [Acidimicrobiia bacterium]|nr:hypothetical protein [Acidimicrobiia bacterium]